MFHVLVSPYESGAQLAYFYKIKSVDLVISNNPSCLMFGARSIFYQMDPKLNGYYLNIECLPSALISDLNPFSFDRFLQLSILSGSEYFPAIKGMGFKKIQKMFRTFGNVQAIVQNLEARFCKTIYNSFQKIYLLYKYCPVYCPQTESIRFLNPLVYDHQSVQTNSLNVSGILKNFKLNNGFEYVCLSDLYHKKQEHLIKKHYFPQEYVKKCVNNQINVINFREFSGIYLKFNKMNNTLQETKYQIIANSITSNTIKSKLISKILSSSAKKVKE